MSAIQRDQILQRIISLQSVRYDGSYADCHHSFELKITQCNYTDVPNAEWTRLLVHEGPDGTIILESVSHRNHYVDAHHSGVVKLTHSPNPPLLADWAQWRMINVADDNVIALESVRYAGSYMDAHHDGTCRVTAGDSHSDWAQWRLGIGPGLGIRDGYEVVASLDNMLDRPAQFDYKYTVGISVTQGSSTTVTSSLSQEVSQNLSYGPIEIGSTVTLSFSAEWSTSRSQTWSESTEVTTSVEVPAMKKVLVSQLRGTYGPLKVNSNHTQLSYEDM